MLWKNAKKCTETKNIEINRISIIMQKYFSNLISTISTREDIQTIRVSGDLIRDVLQNLQRKKP